MERKFHGSESSLYGLFAPGNESAEERKGLESDYIQRTRCIRYPVMYHATNRRRLTVSGLTVSAIYTHWLMITSSSGVGVSTRRILCRLEAHGHLDTNHYIGVIISHASLRCFWRNQNARKRLVGFRWGHLTALPQESTPALGLSGPLPLVVLPSRAEPQPKKSSVRHCRRLSFRLVLTVT